MEQKKKSELSKQKILDAALKEFATKGYQGASLNIACAQNNISKGAIYHHFKDKNEIYLLCVDNCFKHLTDYLKDNLSITEGTIDDGLKEYFDRRLNFFSEHPLYLGIFVDAAYNAPSELVPQIKQSRQPFDDFNMTFISTLLAGKKIRQGLNPQLLSTDFRMYMDFFNMCFYEEMHHEKPLADVIKNHEERCHRQIDLLIHGILG